MPTSRTIIGIDPGQKGGIVRLGSDFKIRWHMPMISADEFAQMLADRSPAHVFIEKAQAMPGNGGVSLFTYGQHFGELVGVCVGLAIPYTLVPPRTWQKKMFLGTPAHLSPKERALIAARRLFPGNDFKATSRSMKPADGIVDAALIALYGITTLTGYISTVLDEMEGKAS